MPLPPPCVDIAGNVQTVCVAQPLVPAVSTPGINLRALGAALEDVRRLGVAISVSQSDLMLPPEEAARLQRACSARACGLAQAPQCSDDRLTCSFSAVILPSSDPSRQVALQYVTLKASSQLAREKAQAEIWYFTTIDGHWTYWSLADLVSGKPPRGLPRADIQ